MRRLHFFRKNEKQIKLLIIFQELYYQIVEFLREMVIRPVIIVDLIIQVSVIHIIIHTGHHAVSKVCPDGVLAFVQVFQGGGTP